MSTKEDRSKHLQRGDLTIHPNGIHKMKKAPRRALLKDHLKDSASELLTEGNLLDYHRG
jgi:hypothetical protein